MTDLSELLASVEGSLGPDQIVDAYLWQYLVSDQPGEVPRYSASIDAAIRLVELKLPDAMWRVECDQDSGDGFNALIVAPDTPFTSSRSKGCATAPLAVLACLLRALIAQEAGK